MSCESPDLISCEASGMTCCEIRRMGEREAYRNAYKLALDRAAFWMDIHERDGDRESFACAAEARHLAALLSSEL